MNLDDYSDYDVVWLNEDRRFGFLLHQKAYFSIVLTQADDGEWEEVIVFTDDYTLWEERAIDFESDE